MRITDIQTLRYIPSPLDSRVFELLRRPIQQQVVIPQLRRCSQLVIGTELRTLGLPPMRILGVAIPSPQPSAGDGVKLKESLSTFQPELHSTCSLDSESLHQEMLLHIDTFGTGCSTVHFHRTAKLELPVL